MNLIVFPAYQPALVSATDALWKEHLSGRQNAQHPLWDVLMFQAWLQESRAS